MMTTSTGLKRFVPSLLCDVVNDRVARGKDYVEPTSVFMNGVCLVVDISGFTKLSGEFCLLGKAGIDQLQLATNGYMGQLVGIVHEYGGEIIKFAGDALICVFLSTAATRRRPHVMQRCLSGLSEAYTLESAPSAFSSRDANYTITPQGPLVPLTAGTIFSALLCAEKLRTVESDNLSVHVGMSCGELCFGVLGGYHNRWECLVSGSCIQEVSACLDDAPKKQVVMTRGCAEVILNVADEAFSKGLPQAIQRSTDKGACVCTVTKLTSGNFKVQEVACTANNRFIDSSSADQGEGAGYLDEAVLPLLKQFVPLPIAGKLDTTRNLNYLAEIREVTTMFMKVPSRVHPPLLRI
jgi:class 3 adenylate cyclase